MFDNSRRDGIFIASRDLNGDTFSDVVVGGGPGGGPRVLALSGQSLAQTGTQVQLANFISGDSSSRGGIRVATRDLDGDGLSNIITGAGTGDGSTVNAFASENLPMDGLPSTLTTFAAFDAGFVDGVFVG